MGVWCAPNRSSPIPPVSGVRPDCQQDERYDHDRVDQSEDRVRCPPPYRGEERRQERDDHELSRAVPCDCHAGRQSPVVRKPPAHQHADGRHRGSGEPDGIEHPIQRKYLPSGAHAANQADCQRAYDRSNRHHYADAVTVYQPTHHRHGERRYDHEERERRRQR